MAKIDEQHGCTECYEVNKGYHSVKNGLKKCDECGGTVLFLQELLDFIADLKAQLNEIR